MRRPSLVFAIFVASAAVAATTSCATKGVARLSAPTRIEAFCGSKKARLTSIDSVLTSTNDTIVEDRPTDRDVRAAVTSGDGAYAYFADLRLAIPKSAEALGEHDGYARVFAVAIPPAPEGAITRHIYLRANDHGTPRWITMLAFDVQNICVEGKRQA